MGDDFDKLAKWLIIGCGVVFLWAMIMMTLVTLKAVGLY